MFWFLLKNKLTAYIYGDLDQQTSDRIRKYIENNERCRQDYERVKEGIELAESVTAKELPDSSWFAVKSGIDNLDESDIRSGRPGPVFYKRPVLTGSIAVLLIVVIGFGYFFSQPDEPAMIQDDALFVDLTEYIEQIEFTPNLDFMNIAFMPEKFIPEEKEFALGALNMAEPDRESPLNQYFLAKHYIQVLQGSKAVQLVYEKDADNSFSIFAIPSSHEFKFGDRKIFTINRFGEEVPKGSVDSIEMLEVKNSNMEVFLFESANFRFVLFATFWNYEAISPIVEYLKTR